MPRKPISFELDFMVKDVFPRFNLKQFDNATFNIKPKLNGADYTVTGMSAVIYVGVNGELYKQTTGINIASNSINITLDKNMLQKAGRAYAEIDLTDSSGTITSSSFIFDIDKKIGEGATIPGNIDGFVTKYEKLIAEFKSQINTSLDDIEDRFNNLTASQQGASEVIDARKGQASLRAKIDLIDSAMDAIVNYKIDNLNKINIYNYNVGDIIEVMGYYSKGDCETHFRIVSSTNDGSGISINNNLFANIYSDGYVSVEWFGVICNNNQDFKSDELQLFLNYIKSGKATRFSLGSRDIYVNKPLSLVFNNTFGGFILESSGGRIFSNITENSPCLQIGINSTSYTSLSNVTIKNIEIKANGQQSDVLKLFTNGRTDHAFWNSLFENIKVSTNKGKGISIYNGVFECRFKGLRIDHKRKSKEQEDGILLTSSDIGLYLANEPNNNIISSLQFDYLNIWGGYHSVKTEGLNGRYAPDFSCNECHIFDSKMEGMWLSNQQHYNYLKKLHMEFIGTVDVPVWGIRWIGYGRIDGIEGGSDGMLGFARIHNGYKNIMSVKNIATPLSLHTNSIGVLFTHTETGGIIETDCELSRIHIPDYCTGTLLCVINGRSASVNLTGNSKRIDINMDTSNGKTITKNEGVDNNVVYTNLNNNGIYGGKTTLSTMDLSNSASAIRYDLGYGVQANVKVGFYGKSPVLKPSVSGADGGNLALRQLLLALADLGLISNSTTQG